MYPKAVIRKREELSEQIRALDELKTDGRYPTAVDISQPGSRRPVRPSSGVYFGYLAGS